MFTLVQKAGSFLSDKVRAKAEEIRNISVKSEIPVIAGSKIIAMQVDAELLNQLSHTMAGLFHKSSLGHIPAPCADIIHADDTGTEQDKARLIQLDHLTYSQDEQAHMAWNASLTQLALDALHYGVGGKLGGLFCLADPSGKEMVIMDEEGNALFVLTLLAPGEGDNDGPFWAVTFEQASGLAASLGGLFYNDCLLLPLFTDSVDAVGLQFTSLLSIGLTDDGPQARFSSNLFILDMLGNSLLSSADAASSALYDLAQKAVFAETSSADASSSVSGGEILEEIQNAAAGAVASALRSDNLDSVMSVVRTLVGDDLGADVKNFIQTSSLLAATTQDAKDSLCATVDAWLNFSHTGLPSEDVSGNAGSLDAAFGSGDQTGADSKPQGWEMQYGEASPAAIGWSVAGVQAMFDTMNIRASGYRDVRLEVSAAPDDPGYPPQKLLVTAGDAEIMTLRIVSSVSGYRYEVQQNTGLYHDQDNALSAMLGLVQGNGASGLADSAVNMILDGLESALGPLGGLIMGEMGDTLRAMLQQALSAENIAWSLSNDNLLYLPLPYITLDSDGDMTANLALHALKDSTPSFGNDQPVVVEADPGMSLHTGTDAVYAVVGSQTPDEPQARGSLNVNSFDGIDEIMVDNTVVWNRGSVIQSAEGKYGDISITSVVDNGDGQHTVNYAYRLDLDAGEPAQGREDGYDGQAESFTVTIVDGDGDKVSAAFRLELGNSGGTEFSRIETEPGIHQLFGTDGDDLLFVLPGGNTLAGGLGADTFAWNGSSMAKGTDAILDFSTMQGDSLRFDDLIAEGQSLEGFLAGHVTEAVFDAAGDMLSFAIEACGTEKVVEVRFTEAQTQAYSDFTALYCESSPLEQGDLAMQFIKGLCE